MAINNLGPIQTMELNEYLKDHVSMVFSVSGLVEYNFILDENDEPVFYEIIDTDWKGTVEVSQPYCDICETEIDDIKGHYFKCHSNQLGIKEVKNAENQGNP